MIDWLLGKTVGWTLGLLAFALLWPIYKSGFLIRQGLEYKKELRKVDEQMRKTFGQGLSSQPSAEYFSIKKKSTLFIVLPLAELLACLSFW